MEQTKSRTSTIILVLLLLGAIMGAGYFWNQSKANSEANAETIAELSELAEVLEIERTDLIADITSLEMSLAEMVESNDSITSLYETTSKELSAKKAEIKKIKNSFATDAAGMKVEIEQLKTIKSDLNNMVTQLKNENAQLKSSNADLSGQVANADALNRKLQFEISELKGINSILGKDAKKLLANATRATNVRVDIEKNNEKPTGSARRAREISVSFSVSNLPESKKGLHNIYVVIKDAKSIPVKVQNPVMVTINPEAGGEPEQIIAQQMLRMSLFENNRPLFKINPEKGSLHKGYYRVSIYADWGLLGGAEFQLR